MQDSSAMTWKIDSISILIYMIKKGNNLSIQVNYPTDLAICFE